MLSRNTIMPAIMGTYRVGSLSSEVFAEPGGETENHYYVPTDQEGRFEISDIPAGTYKTVIWRPYLGSTKEQIIIIQPKSQAKVDMKITAPTGHFYANDMVDKPDTQFGIADDTQNRLCRQ